MLLQLGNFRFQCAQAFTQTIKQGLLHIKFLTAYQAQLFQPGSKHSVDLFAYIIRHALRQDIADGFGYLVYDSAWNHCRILTLKLILKCRKIASTISLHGLTGNNSACDETCHPGEKSGEISVYLAKRNLPVIILTILSSVFSVSQALAKDVLSMQFTAASDYVFRGVSQTRNKGAAQAGFDYRHSAGPYFGLWASYVDIPQPTGGDAHAEADLYGGYASQVKAINMGWDVGYILYRYDESHLRFEETYLSISFDVMPKRMSATVMGSYQMDGDYQVLEGVLNVNLDKGFWVKFQPGAVEDKTRVNVDYRFNKVAIGKRFDFTNSSIKSIDIAGAYSDTDLRRGDVMYFGRIDRENEDYVKDIWWLTVTAYF